MIKIEHTQVFGLEAAIRGMRNPMNSWEKSDSDFGVLYSDNPSLVEVKNGTVCSDYIGPNDQNLMMKLRNAGPDHRKFMRMITVYVDITAPLYWWKEFDTYRVGTVVNSCSTMHCIHRKELDISDFSTDHLIEAEKPISERSSDYIEPPNAVGLMHRTIQTLNQYRDLYLHTKDKKYWWQMIQLLPSSYNQKRTVMLNYEVLANIYESRRGHKLDEWLEFRKWIIIDLPYPELITGQIESISL